MQLASKLTIGQRIQVRFGADWLPTRLEDFSSERLDLAWPTDRERRLLPLKVGDRIQIAATAEDALYSAPARVDQTRNEGLALLSVKVIGEWQRTQRRDAVRAPVAIRPRVCTRQSDSKALRAGITNLSASGVQVRSQDELKPGDVLELAFEVMGIDEEIEVQGEVKRVQQHERGTLHVWEAGCELLSVPPRLQQKLVQFIFAQQRALARGRKGS